jgi:hypothetical protein
MLRLASALAIVLASATLATADASASPTVRLAVKSTGPGAVTVNPLGRMNSARPCNDAGWCFYFYRPGTAVTVSATADTPPATFARWRDDCQQFGARPVCTLMMDVGHIVKARFGPIALRIAEAIGGDASFDTPSVATCGPGCASFPYGAIVTVTEHEQPGYAFEGWSGWCFNRGSSCSLPLYEPSATAPRFCQPGPEGCTEGTQSPLGQPIPTHFRVVGPGRARGSLKFLGTSCSGICDPRLKDKLNVAVRAVGARTGFKWSGRCHGRKPWCQFDVGYSPLDGSEPVIKAYFP